ncbi:MAG TPA: transglycosylase SLT domain-containing protein [Geomonas sp.]|nr:transglycosylase SLT domain-containing protein [Geomonas sp.]
MFYRVIAAAVVLLFVTLPASALTLKNADAALAAAAERMKVKDFRGAREAALKSGEKGPRSFLVGMSCIKLEMWEEAASNLAVAAENYPLLADYALYNEGLALSKLGRSDQALAPLYKLLRQYPDSRLYRATMILYGDSMAAAGHAKEALETYTMFIERYPSGSDSISALYGSALCRLQQGDSKTAAAAFRNIWLTYPSSSFADKATEELKKMAAAGSPTEPYTDAELLKRANTLSNLGRHKAAADAFAALSLAGQPDDYVAKVRLKMGQSLFKARHYEEAKGVLIGITQKGGGNLTSEARFWLAKTLDKTGKGDEAYDLYLQLAADKNSPVADDALLEAAYLKRFQRKWDLALQLFKKYQASYPSHNKSTVTWELAWASYQTRDFHAASGYFKSLAERDEQRERALYWLGRSLAASGDARGAEAAFTALASEYPFGYYALICNRWCNVSAFPTAPKNLAESLAVPAGFEREKALIAFGLYDEATRELNAKKIRNALPIARLFLEMGNYNGALNIIAKEKPRRSPADSATVWGLNYPLAFRDDVVKNASANALPESLVYAIMRTESNYLPGALSPVGAVGLMQIMPATAERISKGDSTRLTQPDLNIKLGARHLKGLLTQFDKKLPLVIAAYNAGSGNVKRWQKNLGELPNDEFVESIPFGETREYVKKVTTAMALYQRLYRQQAAGTVPAAAAPAAPAEAAPAAAGAAPALPAAAAEAAPAAEAPAEATTILVTPEAGSVPPAAPRQ